MKLWITSDKECFSGDALIHISERDAIRTIKRREYPANTLTVCRLWTSRLLRGTGKRLPKHGTDEVVEIEVTAR